MHDHKKVYVMRDGELKEVDYDYVPKPRVHLITDRLERPLWNPAYRKDDPKAWTDSKSKMEQLTKDAGCVTVGNEEIKPWNSLPDKPAKDYDIKGAYERAKRNVTFKND